MGGTIDKGVNLVTLGQADRLGLDDAFANTFDGKAGIEAAQQAGDIQAAASLAGTDELRRQFDITQGNLDPFIQAGTAGLEQFKQGSTPLGLDQMLSQIMGGDTFNSLLGQRTRDVQGQLSAGGLTRSGAGVEEASNIGSDLALQLEQMLFGRNQDLTTLGQNTSVGAGSLGAQNSQAVTNSLNQSAQAQASGILGAAQAQAQGRQNAINTGEAIFSAFSDPSLKENIRELHKIGPLTLVEWDWKDEFKDTIVGKCQTVGFMSPDVREHYPQFVGEYGGFDVIYYHDLIEELERCH